MIFDYVRLFMDILIGIGVFYFISLMIGGTQAEAMINEYGGNYLAFLVLGYVTMRVVNNALECYYWSLMDSFWSGRLEGYLLSPMHVSALIVQEGTCSYILTLRYIAFYILVSVFLFKIPFGPITNLLPAIGFLVLGVVAITGLGLISASMVVFANARTGHELVRWTIQTLAGLFCGLYYPVTFLPDWVRSVSFILPQTYVLDGVRRLLLIGAQPTPIVTILPIDPLFIDLLALVLLCTTLLPLGWICFGHAMKVAQETGELSKWVT